MGASLTKTKRIPEYTFIICTGNQLWPQNINSLKNTFVGELKRIIKCQNKSIKKRIKIVLCDEKSTSSTGYDIYFYPLAIKYMAVKISDLENLVASCLSMNIIYGDLDYANVKHQCLIVVGVHNQRDHNDDIQLIVREIKNVIQSKNLSNEMKIVCSNHHNGIMAVYPKNDYYCAVNSHNLERVVHRYFENISKN